IKEHWGTVCWPAAPAAPVFWTFLHELLGPSPVGWQLTGKAWPDPPGTVRSGAPDLQLRVIERWRGGDAFVDKLRCIVPGEVGGLAVACPDAVLEPGRITSPVLAPINPRVSTILPSANPIAALRGANDVEATPAQGLSIVDVVQRFASGIPVGRADLASLVAPGAGKAQPPDAAAGKCFGRALASPIFDDGEVIEFGSAAYKDDVLKAW